MRGLKPYLRFGFILGLTTVWLLGTAGCHRHTTRPDNQPGANQTYVDHTSPGPVPGVGIDSQDIVSMTDRMTRDLLATPELMNWPSPPRIVIDAKYFRNEGSSRVNRKMITDRLRVNLNRASNGKLRFLGRHYSDMVEDERALENDGVVTSGTMGDTPRAEGWDFRMGGRITTLDKVTPGSGRMERYHQITFELVERGSGAIIWSNLYEFEKFDEMDTIYR